MPMRPLVGADDRAMMREDHAAIEALWRKRPWRV